MPFSILNSDIVREAFKKTSQKWLTVAIFQKWQDSSALNKTFMEVDGIGQLSRFHCIINYGTQIVSLKKSQSAANIWNFP